MKASLQSPILRRTALALLAALLLGLLVVGQVAPAAQAQTTNLALNRPVTCSSIEGAGTPCASAVDGNSGTRWASAFSDPQWIYVDLGATTSISRVVLIWEAAYGRSYQIQVSASTSGPWTNIYSTTTGNGATDDLSVSGSGRYVRMYGTVRATGYGYSLWEFQIYSGAPPTTPPPTTPPAGQAPYGGTARAVPGTVQAEDYDTGGEGVAYHDTATGNSGGVYRTDGVDIQATTDTGGGYNVGWTATGEWLEYTVNVTTGGTYTLSARMAAPSAGSSIHGEIDGANVTGAMAIPATGGWQTWTTVTSGSFSLSSGQHILRIAIDAAGMNFNWVSLQSGGTPPPTTPPPAGCNQPANPSFGSNVRIWEDSTADATIQAQLNTDFNNMKDTQVDQFSEERVAHLFKPGTYTVEINVPFYESVAGLGINPTDVTINGHVTVDAFNASDAGNATQNFWRSAENLAINPSGNDRWGVAQAAPFRRIQVNGNLDLFPASYGWASGGYISDVKVTGQVASASQQQWYSKGSNFGSWNGANWNMVFSGVTGAPAASFPTPPMTVLATTPISRDVPYLYWDGSAYRVFLPSLQTNKSGTSWPNTPGTSLPMTQFYVAQPGVTAATLNNALSQGCNLFFTPGIYHVNQTLNVNNANTVVLGIGYPTIVNDSGVVGMQVGNVDGVRVKGILFDAGTLAANAQMVVGTQGNTTGHAGNPVTLQDVFFRVGGQFAGKTINSLIVNSYDTIIDHTWIWRADHGAGVGWTSNTAEVGLIVNGNNVLATGLFVEHYQKWDVVWNGQGGRTIFFQNEIGYDEPNQASFMDGTTRGYAAYKVAPNVTTHEAWGLGSYVLFNADPTIVVDHAFEAPNTPGVKFHNLTTVSLGKGVILHVINSIGGATPTNAVPVTVTSYP